MKRPTEELARKAAEKKLAGGVPVFTDLESWHSFVVADVEFKCDNKVVLYANASHLTHITFFKSIFTDCLRTFPRTVIPIDVHSNVLRVVLYHAYGFPSSAVSIIISIMQDRKVHTLDKMLSFFDKIIYDSLMPLVYDAIGSLNSCPAEVLPVLIKHSNYGKASQFLSGLDCFESKFLKRMEQLFAEKTALIIFPNATPDLIKYYMHLHNMTPLIKLSILLSMGADNIAKVLTAEYLSGFPRDLLITFAHDNHIHEHHELCAIFIEALNIITKSGFYRKL